MADEKLAWSDTLQRLETGVLNVQKKHKVVAHTLTWE